MRELTFRGFLLQYVKQLSACGTADVAALTAEAANENPRLREPLTLYALFAGKQRSFLKAAADSDALSAHAALLRQCSAEEVFVLLSENSPRLPAEFHKVWRSYQAKKNRLTADNHTKTLMREKILTLQSQSGLSNYRIYTDLKLNPGNINAWLKYGAAEKISLSNARKVLHYVQEA